MSTLRVVTIKPSATATPSSTQTPFFFTSIESTPTYIPVTTITMGDPPIPIGTMNATEVHKFQVGDKVGGIAAYSVLAIYTLFTLVALLAWLVRFVQRKHQSRSIDKTASYPLTTISRTSLYAPLPATNLPDLEPYDAGHSHIPNAEPYDARHGHTAPRYYHQQKRGSRLNSTEFPS
jgi:hypothetical protein